MSLERDLLEVAQRYPAPASNTGLFTLANRPNWAARAAHDVRLVVDRVGPRGRVCDVGGGYGLFAIGCAKLGMRATLIDDLYDIEGYGTLDGALAILAEHDIEVTRRDILSDGLGLQPGTFDAATCFHVLEHLPVTPRPLFHEMVAALRPGGVFALAGPNAVNLRKRISVPLGSAQWSTMADWYESAKFRGHVREPTRRDFEYIARDLDLQDTSISGMNFLGHASVEPGRAHLTRLLDRPLRRRPSLCSDLYLVGTKPPLRRSDTR